MKRLTTLIGILLLAACAGPESDMRGAMGEATLPEPMIDAAPVAAAPDPEICDDPGDGIGGTGCAVE